MSEIVDTDTLELIKREWGKIPMAALRQKSGLTMGQLYYIAGRENLEMNRPKTKGYAKIYSSGDATLPRGIVRALGLKAGMRFKPQVVDAKQKLIKIVVLDQV